MKYFNIFFISLVILQFISISVLKGTLYPKTYLNVNVYNQIELQERIKNFVNNKTDVPYYFEKGAHNVCKTLFQKTSCELFHMPTRKRQNNPLPSGELCCCSLFANRGFVLCFIPTIDGEGNYPQKVKKLKLDHPMYPKLVNPEATSVSVNDILFLIHQEGSIEHSVNGICSFQGIEVALLRPLNLQPTLFCGKVYSTVYRPYQLSIGEEGNLCDLNQKYIFIECLSKVSGLSCWIKFPILTEQEVYNKITFSSQNDLQSAKKRIIPSETCIICFPYDMSLDLPFGGIEGGLLCFFYKETEEAGGPFEFLIMSNLAKFSNVKNDIQPKKFPFWLIKKYSFKIVITCTHRPYFFSNDVIKLVQKRDSKEFVLKGAKMELVCNFHQGVWGLCFSKEEEPSLALKKEITPQLQNVEAICQQTLLESFQSSEPKGRTSQGIKKRSYACLGKSFMLQEEEKIQDLMLRPSLSSEKSVVPQTPTVCISTYVPEKGACKRIKRSTQIVLLSPGPLDNPNQRPLDRLTASMVRFPVDAVPFQSAPLQLPALPLFTSRELHDSNFFDLDVKTEASQGTIASLSATSYGFLQQNCSSITPVESTSTRSLGISYVSQEITQSKKEAWKTILDIIKAKTTSSESTSTSTSLGISSVSQEDRQAYEETWNDIFSIIKN